jgi:hypothetical protein
MSTGNNVLGALAAAEQVVTLGVNIGGALIPIGVGLVKEIKRIATGQDTVAYAVLIQMDSAELDTVDKLSTDDLAAINAELAKLGKPPISPLDAGAPGPAVDPAPGS